jgi:hypothetical protein
MDTDTEWRSKRHRKKSETPNRARYHSVRKGLVRSGNPCLSVSIRGSIASFLLREQEGGNFGGLGGRNFWRGPRNTRRTRKNRTGRTRRASGRRDRRDGHKKYKGVLAAAESALRLKARGWLRLHAENAEDAELGRKRKCLWPIGPTPQSVTGTRFRPAWVC